MHEEQGLVGDPAPLDRADERRRPVIDLGLRDHEIGRRIRRPVGPLDLARRMARRNRDRGAKEIQPPFARRTKGRAGPVQRALHGHEDLLDPRFGHRGPAQRRRARRTGRQRHDQAQDNPGPGPV